ncbi:MAG TPA: DUF1559 domain-containing protein, partial [Isosphaeraceae bacterium]|nr:DUF1559 domain-containing protein [Isosphaeraceae bacterium]
MRTRVAGWGGLLAGTTAVIVVIGAVMTTAARGEEATRRDRPAPLARYFPRRDLVVYVEFDGLDAHRDAWTKTATYRLLNETTTGAMLEQTLVRLLESLLARQPGIPVKVSEVIALGKHLLQSGFALGINRAGGVGLPRCFALVIRGGAGGEPRALLDRLLGAGAGPRLPIKRIEKPGGRTVQALGDRPPASVAWWSEGNDLVVSVVTPGGVDAVIATLEGREPSAVEHPTRVSLTKSDDAIGFQPVGLAFFDMAALPPLPPQAVALGLDRIRRFDYRWGFHGAAIQGILGAVVPAPRTGIPALFDQPAFDVRHLPPLPGGLAGFTILSLEPARYLDQIAATVKVLDPRPVRPMEQELESIVRQMTGLRLRDDLLAHLGPRFVYYHVPTRVNAPGNVVTGLFQAFLTIPNSSLILEVKDRAAVAKALDTLAERANHPVPIVTNPGGGPPLPVSVSPMRRLKGSDTGYIFLPSGSIVPFPFSIGTRPTLLLGRNALVFATTPAMARRTRDLVEHSPALGLPQGDPLAPALEQLPDRLTFLSISDTRQSVLPDFLASVPNLAELLIASAGMSPVSFLGLRIPSRVRPGGPMARDLAAAGITPAFDPELVPEPDALRPFLFPSVSALAVDDQGIRYLSRESFPTINPATAVPVAIAMLVPAVQSARVAARRAQSVNNLKQIGLALHNFHSANDHFPADIRSKDGKPLLSWRVRILPFLEQQALFNEFKLDQPWDSPHNKPLLDQMPAVFAVPITPAEPGMTFYRGFSGKRAIFDQTVPKGIKITEITDGTSNTIAVVEAKEAVPWTRPESDIPSGDDAIATKPAELKALLERLGGH